MESHSFSNFSIFLHSLLSPSNRTEFDRRSFSRFVLPIVRGSAREDSINMDIREFERQLFQKFNETISFVSLESNYFSHHSLLKSISTLLFNKLMILRIIKLAEMEEEGLINSRRNICKKINSIFFFTRVKVIFVKAQNILCFYKRRLRVSFPVFISV